MPPEGRAPDKLSIIVYAGDFERVHYALSMASAAAATNIPATLFFTMGATRALLAEQGTGAPGWHALAPGEGGVWPAERDKQYAAAGVATFDELLEACRDLGVAFMVCEMGLRAMEIEPRQLRGDLELVKGGLVTFLMDASATGQIVFV